MLATNFNLDKIRSQFPALGAAGPSGRPLVFLDGAGGTQVPASVINAVSGYLRSSNSNIEGEFEHTRMTDSMIEKARLCAGTLVGGTPDSIAFGQNMTTLNFNLVAAVGRSLTPGDEIIVTALDHDANVAPWLLLAEDRGLTVHVVGLTDDLTIDLTDLESKISDRTKVVSFPLASNAVGTITPAKRIVDLAHQAGALAWVDAVAYAPHHRINVDELGCDVLLCSPYKFFGPHLGLAWIHPSLAETWAPNRVRPAGNFPAGHRFETGTLCHEAMAGFIAAVEYLETLGAGATQKERLDSAFFSIVQHEEELTERFMHGIAELPRFRLAGPRAMGRNARVGTFGLIVEGGGSARIARALGDAGIYTWNGSFYAQGVMEHLGLDLEEGLLRVGAVHYNTIDEIDRALDALADCH